MPQHWVGRLQSRALVRAAVIVAALALAVGVVQPIDATNSQGSAGGAPDFSLPWADGATWRLTGGPHSNVGYGRPWSSLDFAGPIPGVSVPVRAVAPGVVVRPCANWVQIRHGNGWETSYYHLAHIAVRAGEHVARGQLLGWTSTQAGCGGSATGPHVHFSIKHNGQYVNIRGLVLGGWTVHEGATQYEGCLVHGPVRRCAPNGRLYNFGV